MKCEYRLQPRAFVVNESICFSLSGSSSQWWLELLMRLMVTKTYLYHWLYIFAQFWTRVYCSTTIKCFLSANEFKTESNLSSYMSKQSNSFPLGERGSLCHKRRPGGRKMRISSASFSVSALGKSAFYQVSLNPLLTWHHAYQHEVITFCFTNTTDRTRIVILNLVYLCQIAWK